LVDSLDSVVECVVMPKQAVEQPLQVPSTRRLNRPKKVFRRGMSESELLSVLDHRGLESRPAKVAVQRDDLAIAVRFDRRESGIGAHRTVDVRDEAAKEPRYEEWFADRAVEMTAHDRFSH